MTSASPRPAMPAGVAASRTSDVYGEICLAVFGPDPELLTRQLDSIRNQSLKTWTCFVGVDGSDPATTELLAEIISGDDRFVVHEFDENVGFYRNFERLLALTSAGAQWLAFSDQDDYWYPGKLKTLVEAVLDGACAAVGRGRVVDYQGGVLGETARSSSSLLELLFDNQVTGSLAVFSRPVADLALPFPEPTDVAYHDHWVGLCAASLGRVDFVDETVQDYVQHAHNVIGEERSVRLGARISRLRAVSAGHGWLRYLAQHRWGWRVTMARTLVERLGPQRGADPSLVRVSRGTLGASDLWGLSRAVARREVKGARAVGLLVGAVRWRTLRPGKRGVVHA